MVSGYALLTQHTGLRLTRLLYPQVMGLLPAHQGDGVALFVNKLEGAEKGHIKFTVLGEIGLIAPLLSVLSVNCGTTLSGRFLYQCHCD